MSELTDKFIGGSLLGAMTIWFFYVIEKSSYNKVQKAVLLITTPVLPVSLLIALIFYFSNKSNIFKNEQELVNLKHGNNEIALTKLYRKGVLSKEEYEQKQSIIRNEKNELNILNSEEYKNLNSLLTAKILTETEFNQKVELLRNKLGNTNQINQKQNNANPKLLTFKTDKGPLSILPSTELIGSSAFIREVKAPDGTYRLNLNSYIEIKSGIVVNHTEDMIQYML